ncbi:hypothetical protein CRUP_036956 [Coryphaenoides rupestris]|nr:hypothetical protein CRUP_036956 [Coryphaenoides rupestris]
MDADLTREMNERKAQMSREHEAIGSAATGAQLLQVPGEQAAVLNGAQGKWKTPGKKGLTYILWKGSKEAALRPDNIQYLAEI